MTPDEFAALMAQYTTKKEDVSPEAWESMQEAQRYTQEKIDKGEVLKSWSKEDFPIGLDSNMEPFPLTAPDQDQRRTGDEAQQ
jgi:hypothetical protein